VAVVDRDQLFCDCLAEAVTGGERETPISTTARDTRSVDELAALEADVLVLGLGGPDPDEPEMVRELATRRPAMRILVVCGGRHDRRMLECLEAGASGCVFREQSLAEMRLAIQGVARGETVLPPRAAGMVFARLVDLGRERRRREKLERLSLTARELEVLTLVADGLSNQQIADRLNLSVHTIKNHVHQTLETLEVHSRWDAARLAISKGWIQERPTLWGPGALLHRF
jgi:DNA-binding NarL/FixJ family response regulator